MHEYFGCLCTLMLFLRKKWGKVGIVRKQDVDKSSGTKISNIPYNLQTLEGMLRNE